MASPIEATPTLRGDDAKRFVEAALNPQPFTPTVKLNLEGIEKAKREYLDRRKKHNK